MGAPLSSNDATLDELDQLVEPLRAGDEAAVERLYDLTSRLLASVAYGIVHDRHDAEEIVQEAYIRWVGAANRFEGDGRGVRAWLVRTTRNAAIDRIRTAAHRREIAHEAVPDTHAHEDDPLANFPDPAIRAALDALTDDQRDALLLRTVHGFSGDEVGDVLGRNRAAVYQLVRRAERSVRASLEGAYETGDADRSLG